MYLKTSTKFTISNIHTPLSAGIFIILLPIKLDQIPTRLMHRHIYKMSPNSSQPTRPSMQVYISNFSQSSILNTPHFLYRYIYQTHPNSSTPTHPYVVYLLNCAFFSKFSKIEYTSLYAHAYLRKPSLQTNIPKHLSNSSKFINIRLQYTSIRRYIY